MFDTGVHSNNFERMCLPEDKYIVLGESIWLPVEVTKYGEPFVNAWQEGLSEYHRWKESGQLEVVDVHEAWAEYQSTHPSIPIPEVIAPMLVKMDTQVISDIQQMENSRDDFLLALERDVRGEPTDLDQRNNLAITYAEIGEYEKAKEVFEQILGVDPDDAAAHNNLGNLYVIGGRADEAIQSYEKARDLSPDDPGIYLNLGLGHLITDNRIESQRMLEQAFQRLGSYEAACRLMGLSSQEPEARGAKEPLLASEMRELLISAAKGVDVEAAIRKVRLRAAEAGRKEIYFYWKR
jgi:tetratricopeptide (TPR) repeat protein